MCMVTETSLLTMAKAGISSAITVYKLYEILGEENETIKFKTQTAYKQRVFEEGIALSNFGCLNYSKCCELMIKMKRR